MKDLYDDIRRLPGGKKTFESCVYDLTIEDDGSVHRVMPRHVKTDPIRDDEIWCCNFLRYYPGREIEIRLKYVNEDASPVMKRGAFIIKQNRYVPVTVEDGVPVPEFIEVDCSGLQLKDTVRLDRLIIPDGVKTCKKVKSDFLVGSVYGRARDVEE
eukprot:CAMPEP_0113304114 /NCGR_PEP_ID=MMETSP0010_2-20120614/4246_1 /TAXON_ID=216773 ORGANISM="Corethron hystrix, Strain 308" /NCGR_SAMPLE_ID=MMETSP0010_2 /ASSEMBLY_ACC=CAM_ASM_000155 /LENGTH=155 /DNA_ID=CAMNT_0000158219 /DNA_START=425 /DNA_END=892 /DNA_ORIENTATION=+ /assembly_acc=CAM_ASM_000155